MLRRSFICRAGSAVIGLGVFGNVAWAQDRFIGDSPTATDILGPFYRPNAPIRTNLNPPGFKDRRLHLSGMIIDGKKRPVKNCLIEVWQCESDGFYDNVSDEYRYRASQITDKSGMYRFVTVKPVPEPTNEKLEVFRPPHIHFRISAKGQQDLITQIYFQDDDLLEEDPSTRSGLAVNRVLKLRDRGDQSDEIKFNIVLRNEYVPADAVYQKVSGVYRMNDESLMEFYRNGDLLFYKTNSQIWGALAYIGSNTFGGKDEHTEARFELLPYGEAKVWFRFSRRTERNLQGSKILNYSNTTASR